MNLLRWTALIVMFGALYEVTNAKTCDAPSECMFWEFQCASGHCINAKHYCDGTNDCPDESDEIRESGPMGCSNVLNNSTLKCQLPGMYVCDSIHHCENKIDDNEVLCHAESTYQMRCNSIGHCINKFFLNCSNTPEWSCSDKILCKGNICTRRSNADEIVDQSDECDEIPIFSCNSGECLTAEKFCDGIEDCKDGSDEIIANSTMIDEGVVCSNKWNSAAKRCLLPGRHVCDNIDHCDERIDECQPGCKNSFLCKNGKCIHSRTLPYICNGKDECGDSSDECNDDCQQTFKCNDGTCLAIELYCDGRIDCPDGSDEIKAELGTKSDVVCGNRHNPSKLQCVLPRHQKCDGVIHCDSHADEHDCLENTRWHKCDNGKLVESLVQVCNFRDECCDSSDECGIPDCNKTFTCPNNSSKCIAFERFCDGTDDCGDGSDEITLEDSGLLCNNRHNDVMKTCVLPQAYICDGLEHCHDRVDECTPGCGRAFFCNSGQCIKRSALCDGVNDCPDHSDELTRVPGFKCAVKHPADDITRSCVMPQDLLFDSTHDCQDQSDACGVSGICFKCLTEEFFVGSQQVCDGIIDCPDFSDECICTIRSEKIEEICNSYCMLEEESQSCRKCGKENIVCDDGSKCIARENVCDGRKHCVDGLDENVCTHQDQLTKNTDPAAASFVCNSIETTSEVQVYKTQCNGIIECQDFEDECAVKNEIRILNETGSPERFEKVSTFVCGNRTAEVCSELYDPVYDFYHCPDRPHQYLFGNNICDGTEDCARRTGEELSVDERWCEERVKCSKSRPLDDTKVTIHKSQLCDSRIDCIEEEDEAEELCQGRAQYRFYCESRVSDINGAKIGPLFVSKLDVLDGNNDCADGSDECPTQLFNENTFSSRHRMIRNVILSGLVWVMGVLAILGNSVVMWHSVKKLKSTRRFSTMMKSNYILVFNLAAADFLMGVYLFALAIQNASTDGRYCRVDLEWRSGAVCSAMGSLALISIQSSVFFLVLLTTYRVVAVLRPFRADSLRVRYTILFVALAWLLAILLAIIPRLPQLEDYFASSVWVSPGVHFFDSNSPSKQEIGRVAKILSSYLNVTDLGSDMTWEQIRSAISIQYPAEWPKFEIHGYFGYYSAHSVCLPKFFVKVNENAWAYSVAIMTFDLASFIYIATSYRVIYNDATRGLILRNCNDVDENKTMQARITRLVLTDFFCLIPVCITAFLSVIGVEIIPAAYAVAAIVLLPINSALNPIIYSNVLSVLYSSCVTPLTACVTKRIVRKQREQARQHAADRRYRPLGRNGFNYNMCHQGSSVTSNDDNLTDERRRLGSSGSTSTTNQFNISEETTNTKI